MSFVIWAVNCALGEMATYLPVRGVTPASFVSRYCCPDLGFATSYIYVYSFALLVPSECVAGAIVAEYWTDKVPTGAWIAIILSVVVLLNIFAVQIYGETEFWFASIKIITIIGLIIVGIVIFFGGAPNHDRLGFRYWKDGQAFKPYLVEGSAGIFCGFWNAIVRAGYSVIMSPELITIATGETEAPRRNIPKATKRFIYRVLFFYIVSVLIVGCIVSSSDPRLLSAISNGEGGGAASPFVIAIQNSGIPVLNHIINFAILTSAWSAGNSFLYSGSRSLYSLSVAGKAPKIFRYCNKGGVPYVAVLTMAAIACLGFLNVSASSANVFTWLTNLSTIAGFIAWVCLLITYLRFRKAMNFNQVWHTMPFVTPFQPYISWVALVILIIVTITNGFTVFVGGSFTAADFVAAYITLPIFFALYLGHKLYTGDWRLCIPPGEVDITTGLAECEAVERMTEVREPRNVFEKVWMWIA